MLIVLLPGLHGTDGLFAPLLQHVPAGFEVKTCCYRTDVPETYAELFKKVRAQIDGINQPFVIVGESFSGPLAVMLEASRPKLLRGIILVGTFVSAPNFKTGKYLPWKLGFRLARPLYKMRKLISSKKSRAVVDAISAELQKVSPKVLAFRIQQVFDVDVSKALSECDVPVAYFRGRYDYVVPKKNLRRIVQLLPQVSVSVFPTQHFILQSVPVEVWQEITRFVESIKRDVA